MTDELAVPKCEDTIINFGTGEIIRPGDPGWDEAKAQSDAVTAAHGAELRRKERVDRLAAEVNLILGMPLRDLRPDDDLEDPHLEAKLIERAKERVVGKLAAHPAAEQMQVYDGDVEAAAVGEDLIRFNDTGIIPIEFKVLVLPDESEVELRARRSGLVIPDEAAGIYRHAAVTGVIIALSPAAFSFHDWPEGTRLPIAGDRVSYARYAGMRQLGRPHLNEKGHEEQTEYRLLNDKDVAAILEF